jgi:FkbM family methyltransferase
MRPAISNVWQRIKTYSLAMHNLGIYNALHLKFQQFRVRLSGSCEPFVLRSVHSTYPLWCRPGTSDANVFYQIFILREYSCLDDVSEPAFAIDCGANVGYSSAYLLSRFKDLRIVAIEPDPGNAEMLERNLRPFGNRASIVRSAVWSHPTGLLIDRSADGGEWAVRVRECYAEEQPCILATTVAALLEASGASSISILKMDVEGAEAVIFRDADLDWLDRTDNIVIELHGEESRQTFASAMSERPFTVFQQGELTVCKRQV